MDVWLCLIGLYVFWVYLCVKFGFSDDLAYVRLVLILRLKLLIRLMLLLGYSYGILPDRSGSGV